jgi:argininosuccinate synthase
LNKGIFYLAFDKSRGCYETPAGTVMLKAHRAMESLTLDREAAHLKDELMPK